MMQVIKAIALLVVMSDVLHWRKLRKDLAMARKKAELKYGGKK